MHFALRKVQSEFVLLFSYIKTVFFPVIYYTHKLIFLEIPLFKLFLTKKKKRNFVSKLRFLFGRDGGT